MGRSTLRGGAVVIGAALCLALTAGRLEAGTPDADAQKALQQASQSVVRVASALPAQRTSADAEADEQSFCNTGFFVSKDGHVLTSLLGVAGCTEIAVIATDGRKSAASVAALDQPSGLALLKTDLTDTVPLALADQAPAGGSWIFLASVARQEEGATVVLSPGVVLARRASVRLQGVDWPDLMVASVSVRPGLASAPLLDPDGRLVGVVLGVALTRGGADCLALPADRLAPILAQLREAKSRRLGWLGLAVIQEPGDREGVRVKAVLEKSPAQAAGIEADDILLQIDDAIIDSPAALVHQVAEAGPGHPVSIKLLRGKEVKAVQVETGPRPILICGGLRKESGEFVQAPWRKVISPFLSSEAYAREQDKVSALLEENRLLRARVQQLEERLRQVEKAPDSPAPAQ
jgi:S1-C subfamily serine protease